MNSTSSVPFDLHGPLVDIQNSFGVLLIGGTASTGLLGITTLQTWFYFRNYYSTDNVLTKFMVILVWCIEITRTSILVRAAYYYLVLNWGNPAALDINNWSLNTLPLTSTFGELCGHSYFTWRIWKLSKVRNFRWVLTIVVATFAAWNFAMGVTEYMISSRAVDLAAFGSGSQKVISPLALAVAAATDVAIMVSLIFLLHYTRSGHSRTEHIINMLMLYTVQAGLLTAVADAVIIVLNHYIDRLGSTYIGVYAIIGNLYANSLLASLNARTSLRASDRNAISISMGSPGVWQAAIPTMSGTSTVPSSDVPGSVLAIADGKEHGDTHQVHILSREEHIGEKDIEMAGTPAYEMMLKGDTRFD